MAFPSMPLFSFSLNISSLIFSWFHFFDYAAEGSCRLFAASWLFSFDWFHFIFLMISFLFSFSLRFSSFADYFRLRGFRASLLMSNISSSPLFFRWCSRCIIFIDTMPVVFLSSSSFSLIIDVQDYFEISFHFITLHFFISLRLCRWAFIFLSRHISMLPHFHFHCVAIFFDYFIFSFFFSSFAAAIIISIAISPFDILMYFHYFFAFRWWWRFSFRHFRHADFLSLSIDAFDFDFDVP